MWKWEPGRQLGCDYHKLLIYKLKILNFGFDCYILRYNQDTILPPHRDPVRNGKHYRVNLMLWGNSIFLSENNIIKTRYLNVFRSDVNYHSLTVIEKTYKITFGFVYFKN